MCGVTGFLQSGSMTEEEMRARVTRMAHTLLHRGPDDAGTWIDPAAGLALGFRRLSILDLSPTGGQPMISSDGRYVVVYNGEIYNFRELRAELEKKGVGFRGTSDTEVLLESAACWGFEATLRELWGMFAIAFWDRQESILYLARDRIGKKPLYYAQARGVFLFGSELKALRAHPDFDPAIDRTALAAYIRYGYVPAPYSIYQAARKLPAAHFAVVRPECAPEIRPYWDVRAVVRDAVVNRSSLSEEAAAEELEALLRDAVARRMIADVPLGALLSGGIDSSAVIALMQAQSTRPVKTFTIGFHDPAYNEAEAAKAVARHLHTEHTELYLAAEEAQSVIPRLPLLYDEPFADSSQIPTLLVCEMARRHVTVCLSGDGGDEIFGGYTRYGLAQGIWKVAGRMPAPLRRLAGRAIRGIPLGAWDALYGGLEPFLPDRWHQSLAGDKMHKLAGLSGATRPDDLYRILVSSWKKPDELVPGGREPTTVLDDPTLSQSLPDFTERMMFMDLVSYLPDDILVKVDRASMGVGLEARAPLLDHRVLELAWRLPMSYKIRPSQSKWILRKVLYRYVPPAILERPKMGFGIPLGDWLRGSLRDWAEDLLDHRRLQREGFLNAEPVRKAWMDHTVGGKSEGYRLWVVLMFQAWLAAQRGRPVL